MSAMMMSGRKWWRNMHQPAAETANQIKVTGDGGLGYTRVAKSREPSNRVPGTFWDSLLGTLRTKVYASLLYPNGHIQFITKSRTYKTKIGNLKEDFTKLEPF